MRTQGGRGINERDLPRLQAEHDEREAAKYFESAIRDGQAHVLLADLNKLDAMLQALGMQDTDEDPVTAIYGLQREPPSPVSDAWTVEQEREACAGIADAPHAEYFERLGLAVMDDAKGLYDLAQAVAAADIASAIRARKSPVPSPSREVTGEELARVMAKVEYRGVDNWNYMTSGESLKFVGYARAVLAHLSAHAGENK